MCVYTEGLSGYEQGEEVSALVSGGFTQVAMESWSVEDVCHFLSSLQLSQHEEKFRENAIDGRELLALTGEDLKNSLDVCEYLASLLSICTVNLTLRKIDI